MTRKIYLMILTKFAGTVVAEIMMTGGGMTTIEEAEATVGTTQTTGVATEHAPGLDLPAHALLGRGVAP